MENQILIFYKLTCSFLISSEIEYKSLFDVLMKQKTSFLFHLSDHLSEKNLNLIEIDFLIQ